MQTMQFPSVCQGKYLNQIVIYYGSDLVTKKTALFKSAK